ncbi:MAG: glycosyltransferase family 2 protein [Proteobacteria bacterium]|nr:glycosyltransferase family 2 protein [Pseudomonadota bacterium]
MTEAGSSGGATAGSDLRLDVVIPALNEEAALPSVLAEMPGFVRRVVVADNGSSDRTAAVAQEGGAQVVREARRGYGSACLKALARLRRDPPDVVAFLDADRSDDPGEMPRLVAPIEAGEADLVIGSRTLGRCEAGALSPHQRAGNRVACLAMRWLYGVRYTDLGPFRAVRWQALERLEMRDRDFGWTVEMQAKAARLGLRVLEVPVSYRKRIGTSKISGTVRGSLAAGAKILWVVARHAGRSTRPRT